MLCALILAHHSPVLVSRLIARLGSFGVTCIVHVDKKVEIKPFLAACKGSGAVFLTERTEVIWGGHSIVNATFSLIRAALPDDRYSNFLLISGDTYPVCSADDFRRFLDDGADHIQIQNVDANSDAFLRISRVYLPDARIGKFGYQAETERYVTEDVVSALQEIKEAWHCKRNGSFQWKFTKGSQWWCLQRSTLNRCMELMSSETEFALWFKYSAIPDESLFQTLIYNFISPKFANSHPVFTIWDRQPRPYIMSTPQDLDLLKRTRLPLARKFSAKDPTILDMLDDV